MDNTANNVLNRIKDTASIGLSGGTLNFLANNTASVISGETVGTVTLINGLSPFVPVCGAPLRMQSTLTLGALQRPLIGATVNFVGNNQALGDVAAATTFNRIVIASNAPTTGNGQLIGNNGGILPFAEVQGLTTFDFASYNQGSPANIGVAAYTGYVTDPLVATTGDIVQLSSTGTFSNTDIGALLIAAGANNPVTISFNGSLNLSTGALMTTGSGTSTTTIASGATPLTLGREGNFFPNNAGSGTTTVNNALAIGGNVPITYSGNSIANLGLTANTYTGGTILNAGTLVLGGANNLNGADRRAFTLSEAPAGDGGVRRPPIRSILTAGDYGLRRHSRSRLAARSRDGQYEFHGHQAVLSTA